MREGGGELQFLGQDYKINITKNQSLSLSFGAHSTL